MIHMEIREAVSIILQAAGSHTDPQTFTVAQKAAARVVAQWLERGKFPDREKRTPVIDDKLWEPLFRMFLNTVAQSPFCNCGEEPYTNGDMCPTCTAIVFRESLGAAEARRKARSVEVEN